ncbi:hypothetical protein V0R37_15050 [Pollutimonas sp. H1-120]|uniref:hypothetical protein n=1 Tax=Pollutimonas sp. H1-120 TaxID=3148824 RepID=UPI003B521C89
MKRNPALRTKNLETVYSMMTHAEILEISNHYVAPAFAKGPLSYVEYLRLDQDENQGDDQPHEILDVVLNHLDREIQQLQGTNPNLFLKIAAVMHHPAEQEGATEFQHYRLEKLKGELPIQPTPPRAGEQVLDDYLHRARVNKDWGGANESDYGALIQQVSKIRDRLYVDYFGASEEIKNRIVNLEQQRPERLMKQDKSVKSLASDLDTQKINLEIAQDALKDLRFDREQIGSVQSAVSLLMRQFGSDYKNINKLNEAIEKAEKQLAIEQQKLKSVTVHLETAKADFLKTATANWEKNDSDLELAELRHALPHSQKHEANQSAQVQQRVDAEKEAQARQQRQAEQLKRDAYLRQQQNPKSISAPAVELDAHLAAQSSRPVTPAHVQTYHPAPSN